MFHRMDSVILARRSPQAPSLGASTDHSCSLASLDRAEQASIDQGWSARSRDRLRAYREELKPLEGEESCVKSKPACVHDVPVPSACRA